MPSGRSLKKRSRRGVALDDNSDDDSTVAVANGLGVEDVHTTQAVWKDVEAEEVDDDGLITPPPSVRTGVAELSKDEEAGLPEVTAGVVKEYFKLID